MRITLRNERIVVLILASYTEVNQRDYKIQEATWASQRANVFFLRGKPGTSYSVEGQTLYVPCEESQENILEKTKLGIAWVIRNFNCDYVVRANISCYLNMEKLDKFLSDALDSDGFEAGGFIEWYKHSTPSGVVQTPFISGAGIFMTCKAASKFEQLITTRYSGVPDDIAITKFLTESGVTIRAMKRGNIHSTRIFIPEVYIRAKSSRSSELAGKRLLLIHKFFTSGLFGKYLTYIKITVLELRYALTERDSPIGYLRRNLVIFRGNQLARKRDNAIVF